MILTAMIAPIAMMMMILRRLAVLWGTLWAMGPMRATWTLIWCWGNTQNWRFWNHNLSRTLDLRGLTVLSIDKLLPQYFALLSHSWQLWRHLRVQQFHSRQFVFRCSIRSQTAVFLVISSWACLLDNNVAFSILLNVYSVFDFCS